MTATAWINAAVRSCIWLGGAAALAYVKSPEHGGVLAVRGDAAGWLGAALLATGLALHLWSNVSLARSEGELGASRELVVKGPYRYTRNPIYLAGLPLLAGTYLMYRNWTPGAVVSGAALMAYFHMAVVRFEEPELRRLYGVAFEEYFARVPRWIPHFRAPR